MKRASGFTLLELLMVVIIIAILASIALPQFLRVAERARSAEALAILGAMRSSEVRYKAQSPTQVFTGVKAVVNCLFDGSQQCFPFIVKAQLVSVLFKELCYGDGPLPQGKRLCYCFSINSFWFHYSKPSIAFFLFISFLCFSSQR